VLIDRRLISHFDFALLALTLFIPCLGLVVLYSAGYDSDWVRSIFYWEIHSQAFLKQLIFLAVGILVLLVGVTLPPGWLSRYAWVFYLGCLALLVGVDVFGSIVKGSQRWLSVGGFNIQPAEPAKLAVVLALARHISKNPPGPGGYRLKELIWPFGIFLVPAALIIGQPDLGTALVVMSVGFLMVLFMGIRVKALVLLALPVLVAVYPAWIHLHDYQKKRIQVMFNPEIDPRGSGYHINQSKIAVGSGAVFGKGYMQGTQTQLEFLPEHTTDFVFSVLAEEWGFLGSVLVISVYFVFLSKLLTVVGRSKDLFSGMVCFGIAALILVHTVINIGMVVGILPVVGLPLPLFSYGGSSVLSCMFAIGIVLGLDMRRLFLIGRS
jgi:rod shape determining protein RodA